MYPYFVMNPQAYNHEMRHVQVQTVIHYIEVVIENKVRVGTATCLARVGNKQVKRKRRRKRNRKIFQACGQFQPGSGMLLSEFGEFVQLV